MAKKSREKVATATHSQLGHAPKSAVRGRECEWDSKLLAPTHAHTSQREEGEQSNNKKTAERRAKTNEKLRLHSLLCFLFPMLPRENENLEVATEKSKKEKSTRKS